MRTGGVCPYPRQTQLAEAIEFLRTHDVAFVTLDIGADNILHCFTLGGIDQDCITYGINAMLIDLPQILTALHEAAGPEVPIVGMNYYDPFLAAWLLGPQGKALAVASLDATILFNTLLENIYQTFGVKVADVASAYRITDFTPVPLVGIPLNVLLELRWTWIGATPPDIHPNNRGYVVIALAFAKKIGTL